MREDDRTYYERRLREETLKARDATSSELKHYHSECASLYRSRLNGLRPEAQPARIVQLHAAAH